VFAGGFREGIEFSEDMATLHIDKYQYWMHMSRTYSVDLHSTILYDASTRYFSQSSVMQKFRLAMTDYKIPLILPTSIRFPEDCAPVYVRHIQWPNTIHSNDEIASKMAKILQTDRSYQRSTHRIRCNL
jgi:hypothetical protein